MKPEVKKHMLMLLGNTVLLMLIYFWVPMQFEFAYMPMIYLFIGAVFALYYVIYNRGFTGKNITPEMLPDTMSIEEKQKFIDESRERMQKSKWVLTVIVPIALVFAVDMIYLFVIPMLFGGGT